MRGVHALHHREIDRRPYDPFIRLHKFASVTSFEVALSRKGFEHPQLGGKQF